MDNNLNIMINKILYIGCDFSLNSTAVYFKREGGYENFISISTQNFLSKKIKNSLKEDIMLIEMKDKYELKSHSTLFSERENQKIKYFRQLSNGIFSVIKSEIKKDDIIYINIESLSMSNTFKSKSNFDLCRIQTLIIDKIMDNYPNAKITFITPLELKKNTYNAVHNTTLNLNYNGVKFSNRDKMNMYRLFYECDWSQNSLLRKILDKHPVNTKKLPKPLDDLIDAYWLVNAHPVLNKQKKL
jgi:hypothetical protein